MQAISIMETDFLPVEIHPWKPFVPDGARVLIMGTFPPGAHRWSMDFYYPNPTNDFWRIMAMLLAGDKEALFETSDSSAKVRRFDIDKCKSLMSHNHIALNDTAAKVRRLKGNASDKFLEILEPVDLNRLLNMMPCCRAIATTGEKAAAVIASLTDTPMPSMGQYVTMENGLKIWRMPSTSRAYPLKIERKAEYYRMLLEDCGVRTYKP